MSLTSDSATLINPTLKYNGGPVSAVSQELTQAGSRRNNGPEANSSSHRRRNRAGSKSDNKNPTEFEAKPKSERGVKKVLGGCTVDSEQQRHDAKLASKNRDHCCPLLPQERDVGSEAQPDRTNRAGRSNRRTRKPKDSTTQPSSQEGDLHPAPRRQRNRVKNSFPDGPEKTTSDPSDKTLSDGMAGIESSSRSANRRRNRKQRPANRDIGAENGQPIQICNPERSSPHHHHHPASSGPSGLEKAGRESNSGSRNSRQHQSKNLQQRLLNFNKRAQASDQLLIANQQSSSKAIESKNRSSSLRHNNKIRNDLTLGCGSGHDSLDLRTKLTLTLLEGTYECMVCWESIRARSPVWSCKSCWAVFHLPCIRKWAISFERSTKEVGLVNRGGLGELWRCPGCQSPQEEAPSVYTCFCGKVKSPEFDEDVTPHSCSQICGKARGTNCPHPCPEPCHPGPCPPCAALAPSSTCFCGSMVYQNRCGEGEDLGRSCGEPCGELLGCTRHECSMLCHEGICPPCRIEEEQKCYCGAGKRLSACGTGDEQVTFKLSGEDNALEVSTGHYSCAKECEEFLDCGVHRCSQTCHPIDQRSPAHCWRDPNTLTTCPCGATSLTLLSSMPRTHCTDPIPVCDKMCNKKKKGCGHPCLASCHEGTCPPCAHQLTILCRCKSTSQVVSCAEASIMEQGLQCDRICNQPKGCARHKCAEMCCPSVDGGSNDDEGLHLCTIICNKPLKCQNHTCQLLCHRGKCPPCLDASFDDLSCHCGKTKLRAPIPCGTPPPRCSFPCHRPRACGHDSSLPHPCHPDDVECPPCTVLMTKPCRCGKREVKFVPCYRSSPSCGTPCNKTLSCGVHPCRKSCHEGPCHQEGEICDALCGKPLNSCGHPCPSKCHAPSLCPTDVRCAELVPVKCKCGNLKESYPCYTFPRSPLLCNDSCQLLVRNARLAAAFGPTNSQQLSASQSELYDPYVFTFITPTQLRWVQQIEQRIKDFVTDPSNPSTLRFPPMRDFMRKFLHCIAPNYQLRSESMDEPPNRSVAFFRTPLTRVPKVVSSVAFRHPERHTLTVTEDGKASNGANSTIPSQSSNVVIVRDVIFDDRLSVLILKSLQARGLPTPEKIHQPLPNLTIIQPPPPPVGKLGGEALDELVRSYLQAIRSCLSQANHVARVQLGLVNQKAELVWPKLDSLNQSAAKSSADITHQGNMWNQFDILPSTPSLATNISVKPSRLVQMKSTSTAAPSAKSVASQDSDDVVEDWMDRL